MNKVLLKNALIVFLICISLFSLSMVWPLLQEKHDLLRNLNQLRGQIAALEKNKQILSQELEKEKELQSQLNTKASGLKGYLKASKKRMNKLFAERAQIEKKTEDLSAKFALLKAENMVLIEQRNKLSNQVMQVFQENDSLKVKLSSIPELNRVISALKKNKTRVYTWINHRGQTNKIIEGNRGYLIKNGKSTHPVRLNIEVTPASLNK
ncbi:MAG: hypothetical protein V1884_00015 [Candidatus Omnitrophota bacterium]